MILLEEAFDTFWDYVKQVKSAAELLYENTSVLSADQEGLFTELLDTNRNCLTRTANSPTLNSILPKLAARFISCFRLHTQKKRNKRNDRRTIRQNNARLLKRVG